MKRLMSDLAVAYPKTLKEACRLQADPATHGKLLAGGTDLVAQWAAGVPLPERVTSLRMVRGLDEIRVLADGTVRVGAMVTHALLRDCDLIRRRLPALCAAAGSVGATQIQAMGTVGGNAANASPAGDTAPAMLVTGGSALAVSVRGEREIPLTGFWTGYRKLALEPDEILAAFLLPPKPRNAQEGFRKIGTRRAQAISKVMVAWRVALDRETGRIADAAISLGSVAATAVRLTDVEQRLVGRKPTARLAGEAAEWARASVKPIADIRSTAEYRLHLAGVLVRDVIAELAK